MFTDIVGRRQEALDKAVKVHGKDIANGGQLIPLTGDITSKDSISQLVAEVSRREKYVNVLVNNAGINTAHRHAVEKGDESAKALSEQLWGTGMDEWEDVYRTNVIGYVVSLL
jgi:NAD(P)-dependent dehydrogenase (short-subunit alcohol dehydrogenase family)